jgi:hypothetical protein
MAFCTHGGNLIPKPSDRLPVYDGQVNRSEGGSFEKGPVQLHPLQLRLLIESSES